MRELPLGAFLSTSRDAVPLDPTAEYKTVGVLNRGRGLFARPIVRGAEVSYKTYFRVAAHQFVYSKLFAWEGALTVVPSEFDGYFVSQEFPTFEIDPAIVFPPYLELLTTWPEMWDRVRAGESGMGGRRKRVHPDKLLAVQVPVPDLAEQRRFVDLIMAVTHAHDRAGSVAVAAAKARERFINDWFSTPRAAAIDLGEVATICQGSALPIEKQGSDTGEIPWFKIADMGRPENGNGYRVAETSIGTADVDAGGVRLLPKGTVVFPRVGGAVKTERKRMLLTAAACDENHLAVIPGEAVLPGFVLAFFENTRLGDLARNGAVPSLNQKIVRALQVPVPSLDVQAGFVDLVDALRTQEFTALNFAARLASVRGALLNELLSAGHEIPASYDELLEPAS